jgi:hypothetical protein
MASFVPELSVSQTLIEQITEPDFMTISDHSDGKDEQTNSWFKLGFLNKSKSSSFTVVLNFVPDQPSETNTHTVEPNLPSTNDLPFTNDPLKPSHSSLYSFQNYKCPLSTHPVSRFYYISRCV